jgi:hypothetical protein
MKMPDALAIWTSDWSSLSVGRLGYEQSFDPCRLVRQVKEIDQLDGGTTSFQDPCHLVWQVNQIVGY